MLISNMEIGKYINMMKSKQAAGSSAPYWHDKIQDTHNIVL